MDGVPVPQLTKVPTRPASSPHFTWICIDVLLCPVAVNSLSPIFSVLHQPRRQAGQSPPLCRWETEAWRDFPQDTQLEHDDEAQEPGPLPLAHNPASDMQTKEPAIPAVLLEHVTACELLRGPRPQNAPQSRAGRARVREHLLTGGSTGTMRKVQKKKKRSGLRGQSQQIYRTQSALSKRPAGDREAPFLGFISEGPSPVQ